MGYNAKELKKFNNELKSLNDRRQFVEKVLDENSEMIEEYIENSMLKGNNRIEDKEINITIEQLATYLLRSEEVESSRKGTHTFYETEQDYRKVKIGKASVTTDISSRDDISKEHYDKYEHDDCSLPPMHELFNFDNMTAEEKKNLIKIGLKEKDNEYSELRETMCSAYEYIMDMLTDEKDKLVVHMLVEGEFEIEIARILQISQQAVNNRIKRICEKKI